MKIVATIAVMITTCAAFATQVVYPPLNTETLNGTWEALVGQNPSFVLFHMEINTKGDSYLTQITVGDRCCFVYRLVSSQIINGNVKLRFGDGSMKDCSLVHYKPEDILIEGSGTATRERGGIMAGPFYFIKGNWTRDFGEASSIAEKAIKEKISSQ